MVAVNTKADTMANDTMISLEGISKSFGSFHALQGVDLEVKRGEFLVVLGASGCGKSTLLNLITGFEQPSAGRIVVNGREVRDVDPHCGMVFQQYALFPWLTVAENVAFGLKLKGVPAAERRATAQQFIEMVGLKGFEDAYPGAVRRHAPARVHRAGAGQRSRRDTAGRALRGAGRDDAAGAAGRADAHLRAQRQDHISSSRTPSTRRCCCPTAWSS